MSDREPIILVQPPKPVAEMSDAEYDAGSLPSPTRWWANSMIPTECPMPSLWPPGCDITTVGSPLRSRLFDDVWVACSTQPVQSQ